MKLNRVLSFLFLGTIGVAIFSCNNDDDNSVEIVPPRDVTEVMLEDDSEIQAFLSTHFYNYEEFENPTSDFNYRITFDTIAGENQDKIALIDQVQDTIIYREDADGEQVPHTLYYLIAREGIGEHPHSCDSVYVNYRGQLLSGDVFDNNAITIPSWFNLAEIKYNGFSAARGFAEFAPLLKTGVYVGLESGTPVFDGYGIGAVFFPSGLGYFNNNQSSLPAYSPMVFTMNMLTYEVADQDGDYIPNYIEEFDEEGNLADTDGDGVLNLQDNDDDGDGALTRDEIEYEDYNGDGEISFDEVTLTDTDNDGTPDYLDPEIYPEEE